MVDNELSSITGKYIRYGLIINTKGPYSGRLQFPSPYMRMILGQKLFTVPLALKYRCTSDFNEFIKCSIERMKPSVLRDFFSHKNKDSPPLERCWQMEWYRSATTVLRSANISPDIGSGFNANGFLDFYVNGYLRWGKWSIREHPLKKWAIIDFRHHTKKVRKLQRGFWHAFYSDDFKTIRIRRLNHPDITLTLRDE
ncbi:unnamed protein product [Rhizophagus irregularis]|nr:unnamed protein product [Rhizophagus irregularis]